MDFRIDKKSKIKLDDMFMSEIKNRTEKYEQRKQIVEKHLKEKHFRNVDEIIDYLKSGHKLLVDKNLYKSSDICQVIYIERMDMFEITYDHKVCVCDLEEFRRKFYFALIPYNDYIQFFHKES